MMYIAKRRREAAQKLFCGIACILLAVCENAFVYAQDAVDSAELERNLGPVEFIDNTAPPDRIDTREQIFDIGYTLGLAAYGGGASAGDGDRYFVIHRLHPAEFDKLDGDILGIGINAEVDQIRNLRLIIQGYLEGAYSYNAADAALLARYITIYNAVYRQRREYFSGRYKTPLLNDLTVNKEGLSPRWNEWPGSTLMVIPLQTAIDGSLSAVDTSSITSGEVVDELRKDQDKSVEDRQQMVELKEREADEAEQKAAIQREEAASNMEQAEKLRNEAQEELRQIAEEREQPPAAGTSPEEEQARQAILDEREASAARKDAEADELAASAEEKERQAEANEEFAERKTEEANAERAAISKDQRELIDAANIPPQTASAAGLVGIRLIERNSSLGMPVLIIPSSGEELKRSSLNTVWARTFVKVDGKNIVIAGENGGDSIHRLVEIDGETLQTVKQGSDEINRESLIWVNGSDLYAIVSGANGQNYLGRFNTGLVKQAQSSTAVHGFATVQFEGGRVITQNADGGLIPLDAQSLQ
jgi:hypothetical protein